MQAAILDVVWVLRTESRESVCFVGKGKGKNRNRTVGEAMQRLQGCPRGLGPLVGYNTLSNGNLTLRSLYTDQRSLQRI